jgi:hypothetical protein
MTVWALTALLVAVGRQGHYGEALDCARRAAALAAGSPDMRSLPLQPKFFLGLALVDCDLVGEARAAFREALDDEFSSGFFLAETLMADAQAAFALGEWEDAVPGLIAGGQAAQEKGNQILVAQSLAYRAIIATATGDHRAAGELAAGIAGSLEAGLLGYNAGILAFAVAGVKAAEGDRQGASSEPGGGEAGCRVARGGEQDVVGGGGEPGGDGDGGEPGADEFGQVTGVGAGEYLDEAQAGEVLAVRGGGQGGVVGLLALSPGGGVAEDVALAAPGGDVERGLGEAGQPAAAGVVDGVPLSWSWRGLSPLPRAGRHLFDAACGGGT